MGFHDRDYVKSRKLDYGDSKKATSEKKPNKKLENTIKNLQRGLDEQNQNSARVQIKKSEEIPAWVYAICGFGALGLILWVGMHY